MESNLESLAHVLETDLDTYKEHIIEILVTWYVLLNIFRLRFLLFLMMSDQNLLGLKFEQTLFLNVLHFSICNMPDKLTVYSTLVGLLNAKKYNFGAEVILSSDSAESF